MNKVRLQYSRHACIAKFTNSMLRSRRFFSPLSKRIDEALRTASDYFSEGKLLECIAANENLFSESISKSSMADDNIWLKIASARVNTSFALKHLSRIEEALAHVREGIKILDSNYSKCKPELCHALDLASELSASTSNLSDAKQLVDRSLSLKRVIYDSNSFHLIHPLNLKGAIYTSEGRLGEAMTVLQEALAIGVRHYGSERPLPQQVAVTLSNIAAVLRAESKFAECSAVYEEVAESFKHHFGADSWYFGQASLDLGNSLKSLGRPDKAKEAFLHGLPAFLASQGPQSASAMEIISSLKDIGQDIHEETSNDFVAELISSALSTYPSKAAASIQGEFVILDRRGHIGYDHPHTLLR